MLTKDERIESRLKIKEIEGIEEPYLDIKEAMESVDI